MYAWLMNEGLNVYISITYTAHNQSTQENSGHWRYYVIGWGKCRRVDSVNFGPLRVVRNNQ